MTKRPGLISAILSNHPGARSVGLAALVFAAGAAALAAGTRCAPPRAPQRAASATDDLARLRAAFGALALPRVPQVREFPVDALPRVPRVRALPPHSILHRELHRRL